MASAWTRERGEPSPANSIPDTSPGNTTTVTPAFSDCTLHGDVKNMLKLLRFEISSQYDCILEKDFRTEFPKISVPISLAWNGAMRSRVLEHCRDEHRRVRLSGEVPPTTAATAGREFPVELSLGARRKRGSFFVAHVNPLNFAVYSQKHPSLDSGLSPTTP